MSKKFLSLFLSLSLFMLHLSPLAHASELPTDDLSKKHSRLLKKTERKSQQYLKKDRPNQSYAVRLWSKWVLEFDLSPEDQPTLEFMSSPEFGTWTKEKIVERIEAHSGVKSYEKYLKKVHRKLTWCKIKKGMLYGLTGLLYAGAAVAVATLIIVPGTFIFSPWGLVWLAVPAGANWGTLTLFGALKKCEIN